MSASLTGTETPEEAALKLVGAGDSPTQIAMRGMIAEAIQADRAARSPIIDPPSGQPFRIVGTNDATNWIDRLRTWCGINFGSEAKPNDTISARHGAFLISQVLAHRDHLDKQVTDLQGDNTAVLMRARLVESRLNGVQACLEGLVIDECPLVDPRDKDAADAWKGAFRWTQGLLARSVDPITITVVRHGDAWRAHLDADRWDGGTRRGEAIGNLVQEYADELGIRVVVKEGEGS